MGKKGRRERCGFYTELSYERGGKAGGTRGPGGTIIEDCGGEDSVKYRGRERTQTWLGPFLVKLIRMKLVGKQKIGKGGDAEIQAGEGSKENGRKHHHLLKAGKKASPEKNKQDSLSRIGSRSGLYMCRTRAMTCGEKAKGFETDREKKSVQWGGLKKNVSEKKEWNKKRVFSRRGGRNLGKGRGHLIRLTQGAKKVNTAVGGGMGEIP